MSGKTVPVSTTVAPADGYSGRPRRRRRDKERTGLSEEDFFEQIRSLLDLYRWTWVHHYSSRRSNPGFPDLIAYRVDERAMKLRIFAAELKTQSGRATPEQSDWLRALGRVMPAFLWRPSQLDDIARFLSLAGGAWAEGETG